MTAPIQRMPKDGVDVLLFTDTNNAYGHGRDVGCYTLAGILREHGYIVQVVDFFASLSLDKAKDIVRKYVSSKTRFVGFSATHFSLAKYNLKEELSPYHPQVVRKRYRGAKPFPQSSGWITELLYFIKQSSHAKIIVGGDKFTHEFNNDLIDLWVHGRAEKTVLEFMTDTIPSGHVYAEEGNYFNTSQGIIWDKSDHLFKDEFVPIEWARSCIFNCSFCNFTKKRTGEKVKSVDTIKEVLLRNYNEHGLSKYIVCDPTINDNNERIKALHKMITSLPFDIEFTGYIRVDLIHKFREQRELLLEMGAKAFHFGIETFNPKTAKAIKKGLHPDKVKELLYYLRETWENKIVMGSGFVIGLPYETKESVYNTFKWLQKPDCPLDAATFIAMYIPEPLYKDIDYSDISKNPNEFDFDLKDGSYKNWKSKEMTHDEALEISSKFSNEFINPPYHHYYSRIRNLGFSHEECLKMKLDFNETFMTAEDIRDKMAKEYHEKL